MKGEHFPTPPPTPQGQGWEFPLERVAAELMGCPCPSPLTGWLRLLKEDLRAGGECEQVPGGGPPSGGRASGLLTSSFPLYSLPQLSPGAARLCSSTQRRTPVSSA